MGESIYTREMPKITVEIGGEEVEWLQPIEVHRTANGATLDHAVLQVDWSRTPRNENEEVDYYFGFIGKRVHIILEWGEARKMVHFGNVTAVEIQIASSTQLEDSVMFVSRVEDDMFGKPMSGIFICNQLEDKTVIVVDEPITFNAQHDGVIEGNMYPEPIDGLDPDLRLFLSPDATRTEISEKAAGGLPKMWTLARAIFYICDTCNEDQDVIANPTFQEIVDVVSQINPDDVDDETSVGDDGTLILRNFSLPQGRYLPALLDHILAPFSLAWTLEISDPDDSQAYLMIYRRGRGREDRDQTFLELQEYDKRFDPELSNVKNLNLAFPFSELYNVIEGYGDHMIFESTYELYRAWPLSQDTLRTTPQKLQDDTNPKTGKPWNADNPDAWRKWVLNEAGDYTNLRKKEENLAPTAQELLDGEDKDPYGATEVYDFTDDIKGIDDNTNDDKEFRYVPPLPSDDYDGWFTYKRRKFLPTLTRSEDNSPIGKCHGTTIEYTTGKMVDGKKDDGSPDPDHKVEEWKEFHGEVRLLTKECGIYFTGLHPPKEIMANPKVKVRITASVKMDCKIWHMVERSAGSVYPRDRTLSLDLSKRFKLRLISKYSIYRKEVDDPDTTTISSEVNDFRAMRRYIKQMRQAWDLVLAQGPVTIEGLDWDYQIGDAIQKVEGRNIPFGVQSSDNKEPMYPVVSGISYAFQSQQMVLNLEHHHAKRRKLEQNALRSSDDEFSVI